MPTLQRIEQRLIRQNEHALRLIGRLSEPESTSEFVRDSISDAMIRLMYSVSDTDGQVSESDAEQVPVYDLPRLIMLADLMLKQAILGNMVALVTERDGVNSLELSNAARSMATAIRLGREIYESTYVSGSAQMVVGDIAPKPQPPDAINESRWV